MSDTTTATAAPGPAWYVRLVWLVAAFGFSGLWWVRLQNVLSESGGVWDWILVVILPFTFLWCIGNALGYGVKPKG